MSVSDVKSAFQRVTTDRKIDVKDVDTILESAGSISKDEQAPSRPKRTSSPA